MARVTVKITHGSVSSMVGPKPDVTMGLFIGSTLIKRERETLNHKREAYKATNQIIILAQNIVRELDLEWEELEIQEYEPRVVTTLERVR